MINTEISKVQYTTVAEQSAPYVIPFEFYTNPVTAQPELSVQLGDKSLAMGTDYTLTPAGLVLVQADAGKTLTITRDIPLTQEQDYTTGLIDPEEIEKGFDRSVMRDQMLADGISSNSKEITQLSSDVDDARKIAEQASADAESATKAADAASKNAEEAKKVAESASGKAQEAIDTANSYDERITQAQSDAASAKATANNAAEDLVTVKNDQRDLGDQVSGIESKIPGSASETNQLATKDDLSKAGALPEQAGNAGKFLTTDGTIPSWADVAIGGAVSSVNGKTGAVVLTGNDINSTLTGVGSGSLVTATVTEHLQTLKNDEKELGNQVSNIQSLIPGDASNTNMLATKNDLSGIDALPEQTGNAGKFLTTDGSTASWGSVSVGGAVDSVNGKTGVVVLSGEDINSTLTGDGSPVTATVTEHLQTLKNDERELGDQTSKIQSLIPSDASETNLLATKSDIPVGGLSTVSHDATLAGSGTDADPLKVADNTYLPLSGGTMTGALKITAGTSGIQDQYGNAFLTVGDYGDFTIGHKGQFVQVTTTILPVPSTKHTLGDYSQKWLAVYTTKLNNGADLAVPTTGGTLARLEDIPAPELPTQEGNAGKFLTTNGTEVSWAEVQGGVSEIFHDDSLSGKGTEAEPLSVARPAAIIREW